MAEDDKCGTCQGSGWIWVQVVSPVGEPGKWVKCTTCSGTGKK